MTLQYCASRLGRQNHRRREVPGQCSRAVPSAQCSSAVQLGEVKQLTAAMEQDVFVWDFTSVHRRLLFNPAPGLSLTGLLSPSCGGEGKVFDI